MRLHPCLSYHKFKHIQMFVLSLSTASNPSGELVSLNRFEKQVMCSVHQLDAEIISHHATMFSKKKQMWKIMEKNTNSHFRGFRRVLFPVRCIPTIFDISASAAGNAGVGLGTTAQHSGQGVHWIRFPGVSKHVFSVDSNCSKRLYFQVNTFHLFLIGKLSCLMFCLFFFRLQKLRILRV